MTQLPRWLAPIGAFVGPAAVMTAGIMGAGSTSALILAGAWFRYDLLWVTLITLPAVVVCLDSGARIGVLSGGRGFLSVIRDEIHPLVTWIVLGILVLFNIFVNMGQISVMTTSFLSFAGTYPPGATAGAEAIARFRLWEIALSGLFALGVLSLLLSGGYERAQKLMTGLLFFMFLCFLLVAMRGLSEISDVFQGLAIRIPDDLPVPGTETSRDAYASIIAIAGGALAAAPLLSFSYFAEDDHARKQDLARYFWKAVLNLGVIFGLYSLLVLVAGGFALYPLADHARIEEVHEAGRVLTRALPENLAHWGPKVFAAGLFAAGLTTLVVVAQLMCYMCLDAFRKNWHYTKDNRAFRWLLAAWIAVPALLAPFWTFPALLKMILLMGLNIVLVPLAIVIIIYLMNRRSLMGEYRANLGRNVFLAGSLALSLWLAAAKAPGYMRSLMELL